MRLTPLILGFFGDLFLQFIGMLLFFGSLVVLAMLLFFEREDRTFGNVVVLLVSACTLVLGTWLHLRAHRE